MSAVGSFLSSERVVYTEKEESIIFQPSFRSLPYFEVYAQMAEMNETIGKIQEDIATIKATLPHLSSREDVQGMKGELTSKIDSAKIDLISKLDANVSNIESITKDIGWIKKIGYAVIPALFVSIATIYWKLLAIFQSIASLSSLVPPHH